MPTLWSSTHGCAAIVSTASYPSVNCESSQSWNEPPEQPEPRMFTPTVANPREWARISLTEVMSVFWPAGRARSTRPRLCMGPCRPGRATAR